MNLISKCNSCVKEDVCKFKEQYTRDTKNILDSIESKELTEVSIKCKKFNAQQIGELCRR